MCGITGIVNSASCIDESMLLEMRDTLTHRGPDDAGIWWSKERCVGFAHRRLSIIDVSPSGHQPMINKDESIVIVFNGEIYNYAELRIQLDRAGYQFESNSDTEVLLHGYAEWGDDLLGKLNGMFAFALYDARSRMVFCARDRAGEKPFFFLHAGSLFTFASELKALLKHPATSHSLDFRSAQFYFTYGNVPGPNCIIKNVRKLEPGCALRFNIDTGTLKSWKYWTIPQPEVGDSVTEKNLTEELEVLLEDSVKKQLIADVPVGILLSGGVDSSLITAMAARSGKSIKTFTISFPGHGKYDESSFARLVARHFGTYHTELIAEPATVELLPTLARQFDEPMCDSSMIPTYLVSKLVKEHCTVALGGDGGDELFGGYMHYSHLQWQQTIRKYVPGPLRSVAATISSRILPLGFRGRNYLSSLRGTLEDGIANVHTFFDQRSLCQIFPWARETPDFEISAYKKAFVDNTRGMPGAAMATDFTTYLPDDILVKVDRASMLASLEMRAPFLDYRIIEFAFRKVPNCLRATAHARKIMLRKLGISILPKELDLSRKQGFSIPLASWFRGKWGSYISDILESSDGSLFNKNKVKKLLDGQRKGYANTERIFSLALFELWRREYGITVG